jgi:K+-sensing histidine kinase KdpD
MQDVDAIRHAIATPNASMSSAITASAEDAPAKRPRRIAMAESEDAAQTLTRVLEALLDLPA